jgi:hypothetical protein
MSEFLVWDTVSMAWTEIGLGNDEYPKIASKLRKTYAKWDEVDAIIKGDVLGSFALESSFMPLAIVPIIGLFFISPFPDWGFEKSYLQNRISKWHRQPRWRHYINPLRLVGYPIAYLFSFNVRRKLKVAFLVAQT